MSLILADTSVWSRLHQRAVGNLLRDAVEANAMAMTPPLMLELLRSARDVRELSELREEYLSLHQIPLSAEVSDRALFVQGQLALRGYHRAASPIDLLVASAAESVGAELWHCDRDFELIAKITGQSQRRVG